eukprot:g56124.t1
MKLRDEFIFVMGGRCLDSRYCASAVVLHGCPIVMGGFGEGNDGRSCERFDPKLGKWEHIAPMPEVSLNLFILIRRFVSFMFIA